MEIPIINETVRTSLDAGILTVYINRPDKLNALNDEVLASLQAIFSEAKSNDRIKALVLSGEGKAFCAGADIARLKQCDAVSGYAFAKQGQAVFRALETLGKPSIAAINGYAFGGGCELCMSASIRIASEHAKFGQPEVKLGVIPGYGGTQRLSRLVGKGLAMDWCMTGRTIDAATALSTGLVSRVVPHEALLYEAYTIMKQILSNGPTAVHQVMSVIDKGYDLPLEDALELEALTFATSCATPEKQEGVNAFLEKRTAQFETVLETSHE